MRQMLGLLLIILMVKLISGAEISCDEKVDEHVYNASVSPSSLPVPHETVSEEGVGGC